MTQKYQRFDKQQNLLPANCLNNGIDIKVFVYYKLSRSYIILFTFPHFIQHLELLILISHIRAER